MSNNIKTYKAEEKLYEFLGVNIFRKIVLMLEGIRHHADNSKNINYHLHGSDIHSLQGFTGYLLYNAVCHGISLVFVAVYFAITWSIGVRYPFLDIPMCMLVLVNLYCIMLQRYTYIKVLALAERRIESRGRRLDDTIGRLLQRIECREYSDLQEEYKLIERIHESIQDGTDCTIGESDISVLRNITKYSYDIFKINRSGKKQSYDEETLEDVIKKIPEHPFVTGKVEQRAASLQKLFCRDKSNNVLFGFSVITETIDCENGYREIVQDDSRNSVEFIIDVLLGAYNKALISLRRTQM